MPLTKHLGRYIFILCTAFCTNASVADSTLDVIDPWIAEAPPVSKVMAAYMVLKNISDHEIKITAATSPCFSSIEFHRTVHKNGMASMQHQNALVIAGNSQLVLEPNGYHMMLFNPVKKLIAGDDCIFELTSSNDKLTIQVPVKKPGAIDHHHHHQH